MEGGTPVVTVLAQVSDRAPGAAINHTLATKNKDIRKFFCCRSITTFEILPQPPNSRADDNPWPQFPRFYN